MLRIFVNFERASHDPAETRKKLLELGVDDPTAEKLSKYTIDVVDVGPRRSESVAVYLAGKWQERAMAAVVYAERENAAKYLRVVAGIPEAPAAQLRAYLAVNLLPYFDEYCEEHGKRSWIVFGPCAVTAANPLP